MSDYWKDNNIEKPQSIIVCAACRVGDIILCGARHWDKIMCKQADSMGIKGGNEEQGFIDQFGDFYNRETSMEIVKQSGQRFDIESNRGDTTLFSEGLY
jgi:hypothetical protein